ncbi:PREDICTED: carbohydrate sulfotransferase 11-like [Polistes canadensis]|uniref:carbohydrate sulfotransferase 11-like n=1 Tax=Polistes canadensis TaxID=91411 RepID=UPI000718E8AB|nr:PREDICTED: carbohydrate sulfotransferase 11-like [Polistes canadensis]
MHRSQKRLINQLIKIVIVCGLILILFKLNVTMKNNETEPIFILTDLLNEAEKINNERLLIVDEVCKEYRLGIYKDSSKVLFKHPPAPQYSVFYIVRDHNISYCPLYKASSTTWLYNLCLLMNVSEEELNNGKEQLSTIARRVIAELEYPEAEEALRNTNKLLVVRHPFERLLSAYRDKLENSVAGREHGTLHFYQKYGAMIVKKYRSRHFVKPRDDEIIKRRGVQPPAGIEPTWREFVDYLINTDLASYADDHWIPYYLYCTPCLIKYDIIAKVETLSRDQIYALNKLGLNKMIKPIWRHGSGYSNASSIYFRQLSRKMVEQLYEKFRLDFELFDYSPDNYYRYAVTSD